ncbi:hypothetical protein OAL67_00640 [bacterium]|nr:hypothetical protein [bacterium]
MDKVTKLLIISIFLLIALGVYSNVAEQRAVDQTKLPEKVELSKGFQRWITNLKNKDVNIGGDDFRLQEKVEIYNTKWIKIFSIDEEGRRKEYEKNLEDHRNIKKVIFSPSDREYIDYRYEDRDGYAQNEVHFYGLKEDKVVDARLVDCSLRANCYFDRAFFLDNDVFVVTELSRNIHKHDETTPECPRSEVCTYTFKVHVIDLINNSRLVYESEPFEAVWDELMPEL